MNIFKSLITKFKIKSIKIVVKKVFIVMTLLSLIYVSPYLVWMYSTRNIKYHSLDEVKTIDIDAIIILGALMYEDGSMTPIQQERLEAGYALWEQEPTRKVVVSNTENAAISMKNYLIDKGIPNEKIETDSKALITVDTCKNEKEKHPVGRNVIFVTEEFHMTRSLMLCKRNGVEGIGFLAENIAYEGKPEYSFLTKLTVRTERHLREIRLCWSEILN